MIRCGARRWYLYVDDAGIKQVRYEIVVSKEKKKKRMCVAGEYPARRCNPKERSVGNERCIEGRDCGREVKASTVFGLGLWTRRKRKYKRVKE